MYYRKVELPTTDESKLYKSLKYRFLKPYSVDVDINDKHDIDRYLDTSRVKYKLKAKED